MWRLSKTGAMNLQITFLIILLLLTSDASCQRENGLVHERRILRPKSYWEKTVDLDPRGPDDNRRRIRAINTTIQTPSPCTDDNFVSPVYELSKPNFQINFVSYEVLPLYQLTFRLRDVANNYTMNCTFGPIDAIYDEFWSYSKCFPENEPDIDIFLNRFLLQYDADYAQRLYISQLWVCNPKNGSFPLMYEADADTYVKGTCPKEDGKQKDTPYSCNITTRFPITLDNVIWKIPKHSTSLIPRPSVSPPAEALSPPFPSKDCTDRSLTYPNWVVGNFSYIKTSSRDDIKSENLNFTLTSQATGVSVFCAGVSQNADHEGHLDVSCNDEGSASKTVDPYQSSSVFHDVSFAEKNQSLSIAQSWVCGDTEGRHSTEFEAQGQGTLTVSCPTDTSKPCNASNTTVQGTLNKPVSLAPLPIPAPPNAAEPGCTSASSSPSWNVNKLLYLRTWYGQYSGGWSSYDRSLELELLNNANNYIQSCKITDSGLDGPNDKWFRCFPDPQHNIPQYPIETYVQFNVDTRHFAINQTWYCNDTDIQTPLSFTAYGSATLYDAACGWTNTSTHIDTCNPISFAPSPCDPHWDILWCSSNATYFPSWVQGSLLQEVALPGNALTEPDPTGYSCTMASVSSPVVWSFQNWFIQEVWIDQFRPNRTGVNVGFNLWNSALAGRQGGGIVDVSGGGFDIMTPYLGNDDPSAVYSNWKREFVNDLGWNLRFDPAIGYMELNQSWYCDDKDSAHPIIFNATWNGYLPMNCSFTRGSGDPRWNDHVYCNLGNSNVSVQPLLTWYTSNTTIPDP